VFSAVSGSDVGTSDALSVVQQSVTRGPVPQYSAASLFMNTPTYPVNGAAFSAQQYQPQAPAAPTGPGMPTQYTFHLPGPYHAPPPHGYTYAQYPSSMVMVPPQRPAAPSGTPQTSQPQSLPSPMTHTASTSSGKRKRKSEVSPDLPQSKLPDKSDDEAIATGSDLRMQKMHGHSSVDMRKRTKTQRACDSCRTRKIR
jgi:hypothetical protein